MKELIDCLLQSAEKPALFDYGKEKFWDDPHISKSMLELHLDPNHDAASRKPGMIEQTVRHLITTGVLKPGTRLLDLGCGPGLYAEKLKQAGIDVVGIDISENSLAYARKRAEEMNLDIEYRHLNFFDMDYEREFDAVIQVYGELSVFSDDSRDRLLKLVGRALKVDGTFVFDVSTRELRRKYGLQNGWHASEGGFWNPGRHIVLEQGFDYPEADVWADQYTVIDDTGCKVYRNWFHDYSIAVLRSVLDKAGFEVQHVWNDLAGSAYEEGGDWIAVSTKFK